MSCIEAVIWIESAAIIFWVLIYLYVSHINREFGRVNSSLIETNAGLIKQNDVALRELDMARIGIASLKEERDRIFSDNQVLQAALQTAQDGMAAIAKGETIQ